MFLARGVDQSRVEDDENLRLEDIPRYKVPFPKHPELVGSLVHALDIISSSKYSSGRIGAAVRIKPKVTSQKDNDLMWSRSARITHYHLTTHPNRNSVVIEL